MIKLNPLTMSSITISSEQHNTLEWSDKALFEYMYTDYKAVKKGSRGQVTKLLNDAIVLANASTNVQNALKKVAKLAFNYVDMQVITKFDGLEYSNINALVKLFKYVDKHMIEKSEELRDKVKGVYSTDMSSHRYNNTMSELITKLKEEYKLKEQEGEFVLVDYMEYVKTNITNLTKEQLLALMDIVSEQVDKVEVAELGQVA